MAGKIESPGERKQLIKWIYAILVIGVIAITTLYGAAFFKMLGIRWN